MAGLSKINLFCCEGCHIEFGVDVAVTIKNAIKCPMCLSREHVVDHNQHTSYCVVKERKSVSLYSVFEQEFGRLLSPFEGEQITEWEEQYGFELPKQALVEAVISNKKNFRYIDSILLDWSKNDIRTVEEAKVYSDNRRGKRNNGYVMKSNNNVQKSNTAQKDVVFYNWLET